MVNADGENLVFILSTPRSGSSLLGAILGNHPQVHCPPEPWFLLSLVGLRDNRLFVTAPYDHYLAQRGIRELVDGRLFNSAISAFAVSVYGTLLERAKKSTFVDKTPRYYQILSALDELFPAARKVWIKRNPLDVIASCKETWGLTIQELMGDALSPYTFDTTVSFPLLAAYFDSGDPKKYWLAYEDLVQAPTLQIRSLCSFLDLSYEPSMQAYGDNQELVETYRRATMGDKKLLDHDAVHSRSVGRWRDLLTAQEVQQILLTLGTDVFRRLGYEGQLHDAMLRGGLDRSELSPDGRLPEVFKAFHQYAGATLEAKGLDLLQRADVQYTLLAHRSAQLEAEAEKRLQLIVAAEERWQTALQGQSGLGARDAKETSTSALTPRRGVDGPNPAGERGRPVRKVVVLESVLAEPPLVAAQADAEEAPTIFHITHWKAGSMWLADILRQCAPSRIVTPQWGAIQFMQWPVQAGMIYPALYLTKPQFDSVQLPADWRRFVVIRDLRDTLVSSYMSFKFSHPDTNHWLARTRPLLHSRSLDDGLMHLMDDWLPVCADRQLSWLEAGERLIRYEDLLENDVEILEGVLIGECRLPVSRERLREVVLASRFVHLTKGRQRGQEDTRVHRRKAIAGDWKNYFSDRVRQAFKARYGGLLAATGYEADLSW